MSYIRHIIMEIKSEYSYLLYLLVRAGYVLLLPGLFFFTDADTAIFITPIFLFIIWWKIKARFTQSLHIDGTQLVVTYRKYFMEKTIHFTIADTVLILRKYGDLEMHGKYLRPTTIHMLDIVVNNKVKYKLNTEEGFTEDTLMNFLYAFSNTKTMAHIN